MHEDEKLIEEAAKAIFAEEQCDRRQKRDAESIDENWNARLSDRDQGEYRSFARAALDVFEKAHTPTDKASEREEISRIIDGHIDVPVSSRLAIARSIQGHGFARRPAPTDDEREARGIIARALVAEGRMDTFSAWSLASELVSALPSLPKADGRYKAALEEAEDYITRHYLDLNIGREVLDILSRANPDRSTGWAAVKQEGAETDV